MQTNLLLFATIIIVSSLLNHPVVVIGNHRAYGCTQDVAKHERIKSKSSATLVAFDCLGNLPSAS